MKLICKECTGLDAPIAVFEVTDVTQILIDYLYKKEIIPAREYDFWVQPKMDLDGTNFEFVILFEKKKPKGVVQ